MAAEATLAQGAQQSGAATSPASTPAFGGSASSVDPTKNVLDLVQAESKYQNSMREAEARYQNGLRDSENRRQDDLALYRERLANLGSKSERRRQDDLATHRHMFIQAQTETNKQLREGEIRRVEQLAMQKSEFDRTQAELLRMQVANNAKLVSDQLDRVTTMMSERIAKLEQFRYESSGKGGGAAMVVGYVIAFASLAVAIAVAFIKFKPS